MRVSLTIPFQPLLSWLLPEKEAMGPWASVGRISNRGWKGEQAQSLVLYCLSPWPGPASQLPSYVLTFGRKGFG